MDALFQRLIQENGSSVCYLYKDVYELFLIHIASNDFDSAMDICNELRGFLWGLSVSGLVTSEERETLINGLLRMML